MCKIVKKEQFGNFNISYYDCIDSTNDGIKRDYEFGLPDLSVYVANAQKKGKGRAGREFYSPDGNNIYLSILSRKFIEYENLMHVTPILALIVAKAIEKVCDVDVDIKWVNDLLVDDRKVCGILCEALDVNLRSGVSFASGFVAGIGINLFENDDIPEEIKDVYGSIYPKDCDCPSAVREEIKESIIKEILSGFEEYLKCGGKRNIFIWDDYVKGYRKRCINIGEWVTYFSGSEEKELLVIDIDNDFKILTKSRSGHINIYSDGEIRIKNKSDENLS